MRGDDQRTGNLSAYVNIEERIRPNHPLRPVKALVDAVLGNLSQDFDRLYGTRGRPSIPPEMLLRAMVLQAVYSIRCERQRWAQLVCGFPWQSKIQPDPCKYHGPGRQAVPQGAGTRREAVLPRPWSDGEPVRLDRGHAVHAGVGPGGTAGRPELPDQSTHPQTDRRALWLDESGWTDGPSQGARTYNGWTVAQRQSARMHTVSFIPVCGKPLYGPNMTAPSSSLPGKR